MTRDQLQARWQRCFRDLGVRDPPEGRFANLLRRYSEPHRAYHTLQHIGECFAAFDAASGRIAEPGSVAAALWFHDAVYDTHAADNEAESAELAKTVLSAAGVAPAAIARVAAMILDTRHDARPAPGDPAILVDIDLGILGASPERFSEYEAQVRREYDWVDEDMFRTTRRRILEGFLARPSIYASDVFARRLEDQARQNLKASVAALSTSFPPRA